MQLNLSLQQLRYVIEVVECGSINAASQNLYVSQPTLSAAIKEVEKDLGISLFNRTNRGITLTSDGIEFVGYARQVLEQMDLLETRYSSTNASTSGKFTLSAQHYAFGVAAFVEFVEEFEGDEYDFSFRETRTNEIIEDVKTYRSELGLIYLCNFNEKVIIKTLNDASLEFCPLFDALPHVFVGPSHPLAKRDVVYPKDLEEYPRYSFEQGVNNSFFFSEEPLSNLPHKKNITISDRGTLTNLLTNHTGYTISTGVLSNEMSGGIVAIPLAVDERMTVGYIKHKDHELSELAKRYLETLKTHIAQNTTVSLKTIL